MNIVISALNSPAFVWLIDSDNLNSFLKRCSIIFQVLICQRNHTKTLVRLSYQVHLLSRGIGPLLCYINTSLLFKAHLKNLSPLVTCVPCLFSSHQLFLIRLLPVRNTVSLPQNHAAAQAEQNSQQRTALGTQLTSYSISTRYFSVPLQLIPCENKPGCSCLFAGQTRAEALLCCGHWNMGLWWPQPAMAWKVESSEASEVFIRGNKCSTCA